MSPRRHIMLFGGSFNPIHCGHIALARQVLRENLADEVWLMVSPQNPLKPHDGLLDERLRYEIACKALQGESGIIASDFEFALPRPSYTWNTLCALGHTWPDSDFSLLIGADNWTHFDRWAHTERILSHHRLYVYPRPGYPLDAPLPPGVSYIDAPLLPYSSTEVRRRIHSGLDIRHWVPDSILQDVITHYRRA